jgi:hypothetical protein
MFWGYHALNATAFGLCQVENTSNVPVAADALPTYRVYGSDSATPKATGTCTAFDAGNLTGVYKASFSVTGAFARGMNYQVVVTWAVALQARQQVFSFSVY